jgi:hypothetical protein
MSTDNRYNANDYRKLYSVKTDYPHDVKKAISVYTVDKNSNKAHVIGSFSYRSGNSSDVDLFEPVTRYDKEMLIKSFVEGIKQVTKDLNGRDKFYFMEVKAGLDHLYYDVNYGTCSHNNYEVSEDFFKLMELYHSKGFLTEKEMSIIVGVQNEHKRNQLHFEVIKDLLRKRFVLRWTPEEIYRGYKILKDFNGEYKYTLEMAVQEKSNINVEGIFISADNKYIDCSNFFTLTYRTKYGQLKFLNLSDKANDDFFSYRQQDLRGSMYTLLYSKIAPNPFKAIKRMLSYGIAFKDIDLLTRSYKLVNTQYGRLYTFNSQMKTLLKVLQVHGQKKLYMNAFYHHLDYIRWELENLIFLDYDFESVITQIKMILSGKLSKEEIMTILDDITHGITSYINTKTYKLMSDAGVYPLPKRVIPDKLPF